MLRALPVILFVAVIGLGGWALLAANDVPKTTGTEAQPAAEANAPTAEGQTPDVAGAPAGEAAKPSVGATPAPSAGATPAPNADKAAPTKEGAASGAAPAAEGGSPLETAKSAEKGSLKSPYADYASVADEGHQKYMAAGCNGCHGGGGGGGMGPPLTNEVWIYGKDDDTLFRLVALGTDEFQKQGYARKGSENVVGPMPPMGGVVKSNDDLWKIIAWIRSVNPSSAGASSASAAPAASPPPQ